jgi:hypothetical protein
MAAEISLGGTRMIGNVTLSRYCDRLRDWPRIKWLHSRVGAGASASASRRSTLNGVRGGEPIVYTARSRPSRRPRRLDGHRRGAA